MTPGDTNTSNNPNIYFGLSEGRWPFRALEAANDASQNSGMELRKLIRGIGTGVGFVGAVILTLNIERVAEAHRLDQLVPDLAQTSALSALLQRPMVVVLATLAVGLVIGLWADTLLRAVTRKRPPKRDPNIVLGDQMLAMARHLSSISEHGPYYSMQDRRVAFADLLAIFDAAEKAGLAFPATGIDEDGLLNYLTHVGSCLSRGDFASALMIAKGLVEGDDAGTP